MIVISCSTSDENAKTASASTAKIGNNETDSLANVYLKIRDSQEYANFKLTVAEMVKKTNHVECPMETREKFLEWTSNNLKLTNFTDINEAGAL